MLASVVSGASIEYENLVRSLANGTRYASNPFITYDGGTWKTRQVHYPFILRNPWHTDSLLMYYGGGSYLVNNYNIGVATSVDSIHWNEYASNPLLTFPTSGGSPQGTFIIGAHFVYYNADSNQIWLYGTVFNGSVSWQGLFKSSDGYSFTYAGAVLQASGDETVVGDAGYIKEGNNWYMYYTYRTAGAVLPGIRLATSTNGVTWTKPGTQILSNGATYDSRYIEGCQAFKKGSTYCILYSCYNGTDFTNGRWVSALAHSESPTTAFTKEPRNPVLTYSNTGWDSLHIATSHLWGNTLYYQGANTAGNYNAALWNMGIYLLPTLNNSPPKAIKNVVVYTPIAVDKTKLTDTFSSFVHYWKIPRTGTVADNCDSAKHVVTYKRDGIRIPRKCFVTTDTVYIYANAPASNVTDSIYFVGFGKNLTESDSVSAFTKSGITNAWGYNTTGTTGTDYVGTLNQTLTAPDTQNFTTNMFYKSLNSISGGRSACAGQPLSGVSAYTVSGWYYRNASAVQMLFTNRTAATPYCQIYLNASSNIICHFGSGSIFSTTTTNYKANSWGNIAVVYDGSGVDNAARGKVYVDGVLATGTYTGTIPATMPTFTGAYTSIGCIDDATSYTFQGYIDEVSLSVGAAKKASYIKDQYTMLSSNNTFYFYGSPVAQVSISTTGSRCSAYKQAYKSAYKQAWK